MKIEYVIKDGDKYYCKICQQELVSYTYTYKSGKNKGLTITYFKHKSKSDSNRCSRIGKPGPTKGMTLSTKGKPSGRKGKKMPNISKALKGRSAWNKGFFKNMPEVNEYVDELIYPKTKICLTCKKLLHRKIYTYKVNFGNKKVGNIKNIIYFHDDKILDKKCKSIGTSKEEIYLYERLCEVFDKNEFLWAINYHKLYSIKNDIKSYYPGKPDFVIPKLRAIIEYQGKGGHHRDHPYDPNNIIDVEKLDHLKSSNNKFENTEAIVWGIKDPLKRKWCKENNVILIELWNKLDVDNFIDNIKNNSSNTFVLK